MTASLGAAYGIFLVWLLVASVKGEAVGVSAPRDNEASADPCTCAKINFWDATPHGDITECCRALRNFCKEANSIHCGHVHRFCMSRRSGFSAWILDNFVRDKLRPLKCEKYNVDATHDAACGDAWCRIGYACTSVPTDRCRNKPGSKCGKGFCRHGAECAETSSQVCKEVPKKEVKNVKNKKDVARCTEDKCFICTTQTDHECVLGKEINSPCRKQNCADFVACGKEDEPTCTLRPEAAPFIGAKAPKQHKPEKVSDHLRRFTAVLVPTVSIAAAAILIVALISWGSIRVRQAKQEAAAMDDEDSPPNQQMDFEHQETHLPPGSSLSEFEFPLSPGRASMHPGPLDPSLHLPLGAAKLDQVVEGPYSAHRSARSAMSGSLRMWTPRSGYQSMTEQDLDAPSVLANHMNPRYNRRGRSGDSCHDYDGDYSDCGNSARGYGRGWGGN